MPQTKGKCPLRTSIGKMAFCLINAGFISSEQDKHFCPFVEYASLPTWYMVKPGSSQYTAPSLFYGHVVGDDLVVSVLGCQSRCSVFQSLPGQHSGPRFLLHLRPVTNSAVMGTLSVHCQWDD